ncbi:MAG: ATP-binding cassette domain-containing protein [bacterium]|nr:ATP-binding cassette domain-containing protein [bacterium]
MEKTVVEYIKKARSAGLSYEQIAEQMGKAGWNMANILHLLLSLAKQAELPEVPLAVSAKNIKKSYGSIEALKGVSIKVPFGKVFGLLGPNGAGKTTLVRILTTLLTQDSGSAAVAGYDVRRQADEVRSVVGLTGQYTAIDDYLTGRENLELVGRLYHLKKDAVKARARELLDKFGLIEAADRPAKTYSGGMRRRLDLAMGLFNHPKVLFLDEPTNGLDPQSRIALWQIIKEQVAEGRTVLLTTQYLEEADNLADVIVVLNHGQVIAEGTPEELKSKIGGDVLEIHLKEISDAARVAELLRPISKDEPRIEDQLGIVSVPAAGGASSLVAAVRLMDREGIPISDIMLRRPTLDDVFLTLTGHKQA